MTPSLESRRRVLTALAGATVTALAGPGCASLRRPAPPFDPAHAPDGPRPPDAVAVGLRRTELRYPAGSGEERRRDVLLWYPTSSTPGPYDYGRRTGFVAEGGEVAPGRWPTVVFSHGYLSGAARSAYIAENLARAGYVVAAPNHADAFGEDTDDGGGPPQFARPQSWTEQTFADRRDDLVALLDWLERESATAGSAFEDRVDPARLAALGHSLGGYTALGLGGLQSAWRDPRVRAVVAMSPYAAPYLAREGARGGTVPTMLQGGTLDVGITSLLPQLFERLDAPKYSLVLRGANHFAWTNLAGPGKTTQEVVRDGNPRWIVAYAVAFLDEYVAGTGRADALRQSNAALASFTWRDRAVSTPTWMD